MQSNAANTQRHLSSKAIQIGEEAVIKTTTSGCDSSLSGAAPSGPIQPYFKSTATSNGKMSIDHLVAKQTITGKGVGILKSDAVRSCSIEYDPTASNEYTSMNAEII